MSDVTLTSAMRNNLAQLRMTNMLMDTTQNRIATGNKVNSALDDPTAFFKSKGLKDDANDLAVLKDDMGQTISSIQAADKAITSITELVEQAKSLANSAKSESSATERASLAAQFDDIRAQIDTLAADASYGGQNLVSGRGTITGGTFLDTTSTTEAALSGVATGGIVRTGTDTGLGDYAVSTQAKVNSLNTVITGAGNDLTGAIDGAVAGSTDGDLLTFYIDGVSVGTATATDVSSQTGTAYAALVNALSTDLTATIVGTALQLTVAEGKVLEVRETASTTGTLLADLGLSAGLQNDATGATVVDLTSDLGIYGAEVYAHVSGYTDNTSTSVTFSVSGTTLTVTDGTGSSATMSTTAFAAAGTDTLAIGDLTVNFVTSTSTEQANTSPVVTGTVAAVAQVGHVSFSTSTYEIGDEITVVVNGNSYAYTFTASPANATAAVSIWEDAMDSTIEAAENVTLSVSAGTMIFTSDTAGDAFTLASTQTIATLSAESAPVVNASTTANAVQTSTIAIQANVDDGDVYSVTINSTVISYTALAADTDQTAIAAGLTAAINANTTLVNGSSGVIQTATVVGGTITIQENSVGTVLTISASATDASISLGNASSTSSTQTLKSLTTGTATGDMRVKVTSGGVTETVNVNTSSTTAATISNSAWGSTFTFTADDATMVAGESSTISVTNPTGIGANDATVTFNTDGTSTINVQAVDVTSSGLSISAASGSWATNTLVDAAITELDAAKTSLRSNSKTMSTSLGVIQTRETFTENFIDNLRVGADKLTLADGSEEATNMLMLQTRQQLGIQALSMASQSSQSILSLFR
ncbi:MAG: hypothetical protein ISR46_06065 [Rhodospirillales bacterium]|nr:hypothetical protein [Rhodospirillales bacterium]